MGTYKRCIKQSANNDFKYKDKCCCDESTFQIYIDECCCDEAVFQKYIDATGANIIFKSGNARVKIDTNAGSEQEQNTTSDTSSRSNTNASANPRSNSDATGLEEVEVKLGNIS
ncbi:hypothetical protein [Priestia megaterium]|uniref:hypothetical protein n=1 Tax=Priestia megaterium TaxID=1404 RepID=UPI003A850E94